MDKKVYLVEKGSLYDLDTKLKDVLRFLGEKYAVIPAEYRDTATIDMNISEGAYGIDKEYDLYYFRPETADEAEERERETKERQREQDRRNREYLDRLAAQLGVMVTDPKQKG